ncbi:Regulator of telomere elongation helicase 1 [Ancistrocladus abbreviatus]
MWSSKLLWFGVLIKEKALPVYETLLKQIKAPNFSLPVSLMHITNDHLRLRISSCLLGTQGLVFHSKEGGCKLPWMLVMDLANELESLWPGIVNWNFCGSDSSALSQSMKSLQRPYSLQGACKVRTLSWWCFNPGIAMEDFSRRGVGSIILTSGTLSPMDSFAQELKLKFPIRLENPHVISSDQIWAGVVASGPSGYAFNSSYRSRDSLEYKNELGNAIVNFARIVPDGLLVFFPSYYLMEQCIACWKDNCPGSSVNSSTIWERICRHKQPVIEPRQSSLFSSSIDDYMSKLKDSSTTGAVFFAVCRGKVSEGLDFTDHAGRAVVITGLPFATRTDPKVRLKREYLDHLAQSQIGFQTLTGEEWYNQQASRAVNQAVGRVIRHRHDYGALIFCDERFASSHRQSQVSRWIQPHIKCYSKFGDVVYSLTRFFRDGDHHPLKFEPSNSPCNSDAEQHSAGNLNQANASRPVDSFFWSEKKFTCLDMPVDESCCIKSPSSVIDCKSGKLPCQSKEILPANRSSLVPQKENKTFKLKHTSHLVSSDKMLLPCRAISSCKNSQVMDAATNSSIDGNLDEEWNASLSTKRPRIVEKNPGDSQNGKILQKPTFYVEETREVKVYSVTASVKQEESITFGTKNMDNSQVSFSFQDFDHMGAQATLSSHGNLGVTSSSSVSFEDEEAKGAAFLTQVKEKLTSKEYGEFVRNMKALKSKAMKIGPVLQSICLMNAVAPSMLQVSVDSRNTSPGSIIPCTSNILHQITIFLTPEDSASCPDS